MYNIIQHCKEEIFPEIKTLYAQKCNSVQNNSCAFVQY